MRQDGGYAPSCYFGGSSRQSEPASLARPPSGRAAAHPSSQLGITHGRKPHECNAWPLSFPVPEEDRP
jgi:hypothetical protein